VLQIRNLRNQTDLIQEKMLRHVRHPAGIKADDIFDILSNLKGTIDRSCLKHGGSAADLGTPSYRQYLWLRFLCDRKNLAMHMSGLKAFDQLIEIKAGPAQKNTSTQLKIDYSGYLYKRKTAGGITHLQINEGYIGAPIAIKQKVVDAAFSKRKTKAMQQVKAFANDDAYLTITSRISGQPIANKISCRGKAYDLSVLFHALNLKYFNAQLSQPRLIWSSARAKRRLGYFHPEIQTIAVNQKLDTKRTPRLLVEYILYHEMLHQHFGIEHRNGRRYAHTAVFHQAEKQFMGYQEAENLIKLLQ